MNKENTADKLYKFKFKHASKPDQFIPWLNNLAKEGYVFNSMGFNCFRFEKGKPQEMEYSVDFFEAPRLDVDNYIISAKALGLKHLYSGYGMHVFAAKGSIAPYNSESRGQHQFYKICHQLYKKMRTKQMVRLLLAGSLALLGLVLAVVGLFGDKSLTYVFGAIALLSLLPTFNAYNTLKTVVAYHRVHLDRVTVPEDLN